jgi:hypothetical protein
VVCGCSGYCIYHKIVHAVICRKRSLVKNSNEQQPDLRVVVNNIGIFSHHCEPVDGSCELAFVRDNLRQHGNVAMEIVQRERSSREMPPSR